jgi:hypothetical protein
VPGVAAASAAPGVEQAARLPFAMLTEPAPSPLKGATLKRWKCSSEGMITATSIFASFAGALVVLIVALDDVPPLVQGCILTLLIAFMLFAYTAEMICDARERDDILVYIRAHVTYNLGIVMMLLSLGLIRLPRGSTTSLPCRY